MSYPLGNSRCGNHAAHNGEATNQNVKVQRDQCSSSEQAGGYESCEVAKAVEHARNKAIGSWVSTHLSCLQLRVCPLRLHFGFPRFLRFLGSPHPFTLFQTRGT